MLPYLLSCPLRREIFLPMSYCFSLVTARLGPPLHTYPQFPVRAFVSGHLARNRLRFSVPLSFFFDIDPQTFAATVLRL